MGTEENRSDGLLTIFVEDKLASNKNIEDHFQKELHCYNKGQKDIEYKKNLWFRHFYAPSTTGQSVRRLRAYIFFFFVKPTRVIIKSLCGHRGNTI